MIVEMMGEGSVTLATDGTILYCNDRFAEMVRWPAEELVGLPFRKLLAANQHPKLEEMLDCVPEEIRRERVTLKRPDGELAVQIATRSLALAGVQGTIATVTDLTEIEAARQARDGFFASMSHELRTPLTSILGYVGILLGGVSGPLTEKQEHQLSTVKTSGLHLLSLLNNLLDFAKLEAGKVAIYFERVSCNAIVEEVAAMLRPLAMAKHLKLTVVAPKKDLDLETDRRALSQILINLVGNGIKYTDSGEVRLEVLQKRTGDRREVNFQVSDTGPGIPLSEQDKLFQRFERVDANESPTKGSGLGLFVSKRLAQLIGGNISFKSDPGKGSRFTLSIDGNAVAALQQGAADAAEAKNQGRLLNSASKGAPSLDAMSPALAQPRLMHTASHRRRDLRPEPTELEVEIGAAIESGHIHPCYQPLVDLRTGIVVGCEVLARWKHPTRGLLPPSEFIPAAKATGDIRKLTNALLRQAVADAQSWPDDLSMSLNLSARMVDKRLPAEILPVLAETGFPSRRLVVEITEKTLIERPNEAKVALQSLRDLGIRVHLDDFGVGYSGLSYLRQFALDGVKIDRSFLREILTDVHTRDLVDAMVRFCHSLGLSVTAEGIENTATLNQMTQLGCDVGQGYLFSKATPNRGFLRYLRQFAGNNPLDRASRDLAQGPCNESDAPTGTTGLEALDLLPAQIAVLDPHGDVLFTNQAWEETAEGRLAERRWNYLEECHAAADRGCPDGRTVGDGIASVLNRGLRQFVATYSCPFDRQHHWFQISVRQPRKTDEGVGAIVMHTDVTALQHDHLTGLANRALFESQAQYALDMARQNASAVGLALIDLDDFKPINDRFGHLAGDEVLVALAQRLNFATKDRGLVARLGGDEFGVVTWLGCDEIFLSRLSRDLQLAFKEPFTLNGATTYLAPSIGTALYPSDGETLSDLLRTADSRMYGLKRARKSQHDKWIA